MVRFSRKRIRGEFCFPSGDLYGLKNCRYRNETKVPETTAVAFGEAAFRLVTFRKAEWKLSVVLVV